MPAGRWGCYNSTPMFQKLNILTYICLLLHTAVCAQSIQLIDQSTQKGIPDFFIFNEDQSFSTLSDQEGKAVLNGLKADETLYFQHPSYTDFQNTLKELEAVNYQISLQKRNIDLPEFIISAGRTKEALDDVTNVVSVIQPQTIAKANAQTSADLLQETGGIYIQKSQMGGGSPVIRGMEANKVLLVVDGVRMNNAIYRGGHVHNVITIDPSILERTEVVFGPGSLIYGSDALGGVMQFITRTPKVANSDQLNTTVGAYTRYASVNGEKTAHADFELGGKKWASLSSFTYSKFEDLKIGKVRTHGYEDWGLRPEYIDSNEQIVRNEDENILRFTGYDQMSFLQKLYFKANKHIDLTLNFQYSTSSNVPRFDRLNDYTTDDEGNPVLKFAEWNYGPQNRWMTSINTNIKRRTKLSDNISIVAAYQRIDEDRIDRKFNKTDRRHREEDVSVFSLNTDVVKKLNNKRRVQYGIEFTYNDVQSQAYVEDINTEEIMTEEAVITRYPDGGSHLYSAAIYWRHKWKVTPRLTLINGMRYSTIGIGANYEDTTFFDLQQDKIKSQTGAFTGGLGLNIKLSPKTRITASYATGFRAPNVDDVAKVFEPEAGIVVVPNTDLKSEYAHSIDFGFNTDLKNKLIFSANFFGTYIRDAIVRRPYTLNGLDSLVYDGELDAIYANANAGEASIIGFFTGVKYRFNEQLAIEKRFNATLGRDRTEEVPLGHIPPAFGDFSIAYDTDKWSVQSFLRYNAWKHLDQYSPYSEDKLSEATPDGTPGWYTINLRANYHIYKQIELSAGIENILDHHYKPFASGISGAGRNFIISLRWNPH